MSYLNLANEAAPATPGAGTTTLYATAAGELAYKLPAGTTAELIGDHDHSGASYAALDHAHAAAYAALDHTHTDIDDTGWTTATMLTKWSAGSPAVRYRRYGKLVVVTGQALFAPGGTPSHPMLLLPVGYRPPYEVWSHEKLFGEAFRIGADGYVRWRWDTYAPSPDTYYIHAAFYVD